MRNLKALVDKLNYKNLEFLMFVLDELADELESQGRDIIKLTLGKPQQKLHDDIVNAHIDAVKNQEKRNQVYPEGLPLLRTKIAEWYTSIGNPVDPKHVLVNTGTSPFFKDLFRFLLTEEDEILLPKPYYSVYNVSALLTPAKIKFYEVDKDTFRIDQQGFKENYDPKKTRIVVFCSPGNPYGNVISKEEYSELLDIISDDTYILSDEIYRNTGFYSDIPSVLDIKKDRSNIIISNSFSKGFRMYTARVGFCILPDRLLEPYRVLLQHTLLTTNPTEQYAAVEALNHLDEVERLVDIYRENNEYTVNKFSEIAGIEPLKAEGGFYLVTMCDGFMKKKGFNNSFDLAKDILEKTGVAIVPGSDFGVEKGIRISFTNLRFKEAIDRLANYFAT